MSAVSLRFCRVLAAADYREVAERAHADAATASAQLWSYVDARDAALACRPAAETDGLDCDSFFLAAPETYMDVPTGELMGRYYPGSEVRYDGDREFFSPIDSSKARARFEWKPVHSWREYF